MLSVDMQNYDYYLKQPNFFLSFFSLFSLTFFTIIYYTLACLFHHQMSVNKHYQKTKHYMF